MVIFNDAKAYQKKGAVSKKKEKMSNKENILNIDIDKENAGGGSMRRVPAKGQFRDFVNSLA